MRAAKARAIDGNSGIVDVGDGDVVAEEVMVNVTCAFACVVKSSPTNVYCPALKLGTVTLKFMSPLAFAARVPRTVPFIEACA